MVAMTNPVMMMTKITINLKVSRIIFFSDICRGPKELLAFSNEVSLRKLRIVPSAKNASEISIG